MKLVELCCGSAALSRHLLGGAPLLPYQGSKLRYASAIARRCRLISPDHVVLVDAGPWPAVFTALSTEQGRDGVASRVLDLSREDAEQMYRRFQSNPAPADPLDFAAAFLAVQRVNFRARPVECVGGRFVTHGFSRTDAYGLQASAKFGAIRPQIPALAERLANYPILPVLGVTADVRDLDPSDYIDGQTTVYIDPPYEGTADYGTATLPRADVLALALRWEAAGANVIVSEACALDLPGWDSLEITHERTGRKSSAQTAEWLTASPGVRMDVAPIERQASLFGGEP